MFRVASIIVLVFSTAWPACADEVKAFGRTIDDAKREARQQALQLLQQRIDLPEFLSPWQPTLADVESMLEGPGKDGPTIDIKGFGVQYQWVLSVRFPSDEELQRRALAAKREAGAGAAVAIVVAGLSAWWGWKRFRIKMSAA